MAKDFEALPISVQENWMKKACEHVDKSNLSFEENNRDAVVYMTALYLFALDDYTIKHMHYPCYVVHCLEEGWRFMTDSYSIAHGRFKRAVSRGGKFGSNRAGMFYWKSPGVCEKKYASENYPFETDYIPV